ncbi:MAG: zinc-dependent alcohol dehydrogenase family protein [Steroidobacteraceae bacterium]
MQLLQHRHFGPPDEVLELVTEPDPSPAAHEVLVGVEATPIHAGDLKNIAGEKLMIRHVHDGDDLQVRLPQVPGIEGVGRILATGGAVTRWRVGQRVLLPWQCGSWRDRLLAEAQRLLPAPEGDALQLSLMVNAFTAEFALRDLAPLARGDWFVQNGANSNVGRVLIRLARARGIRTLTVVRRAELVDELRELGADVVLLDGPDLAQRARAAVGRAPLSIALECIGGDAAGRLAECLSDGGTIANYGSMTGEAPAIPTWMLLYKRIRLIGYYAGFNIAARSAAEQSAIIGELAARIADGTLVTPIAATYPLARYRDAVRHAERSGSDRDGKIVFVPAAPEAAVAR